MVVSAGVEDWDIFNKDNRAPKVASLNTSCIHDLNNDVRLYGGANFGVNVHPFRMQHGHLLAGFNYLRKHRLVVVAGGNYCDVLVPGDKSKNEEDKNEVRLCQDVKLRGRTRVNDKLQIMGEAELQKGCCDGSKWDHSFAVAAEYAVDPKTTLKAKASCDGNLVLSYLHSYGVCNFGFVSRVIYYNI